MASALNAVVDGPQTANRRWRYNSSVGGDGKADADVGRISYEFTQASLPEMKNMKLLQ